MRRLSRLVSAGILAASLALPMWAAAAVPNQYVAKLYTEGLGRAPDQGGWQGWTGYFAAAGCWVESLRVVAHGVYESSEYAARNYSNAQRLLTLYRGLLNREPDPGGLQGWLAYLNSGGAWAAVIDGL